jgi:hypothetical protein
MIAIGRNGDAIVFFGSGEAGLVQFEASEEEAQGALRQLSALLTESTRPAWVPPGPTPPYPSPDRGVIYEPPRAVPVVTLATDLASAARESEERDRLEIERRRAEGQAPPVRRSIPQDNGEELRRQAARRGRIKANSGGEVDGPVDE